MSAGHAELVGEMKALENLSMPDRLKHAKKRRTQQLKAYAQYEKQLNKETAKKSKKTGPAASGLTPSLASRSVAMRLQFDPSILLLEATMRNDVGEGDSSYLNCNSCESNRLNCRLSKLLNRVESSPTKVEAVYEKCAEDR